MMKGENERMKTMIKSHFYSPPLGRAGANNFGDMLVPEIMKWICGKSTQWVSHTTEGKLLCIGSEMNHPQILKRGDVIWGYGSKRNKEIRVPEGVRVLAVRGLRTGRLIGEKDPGVYGDPGILMPLVYQTERKEKWKVGVIPHYIDKKMFRIKDPEILEININDNVYSIIDQINQCSSIISTSLHGAIVAEAYGVPTVWLKVGEKVGGFEHKWNDYFSVTGRDGSRPLDKKDEIITEKVVAQICDKTLPLKQIDPYPLIDAWNRFYEEEIECSDILI